MIALAARANHVPFYVAAPSSTFNLNPDQSDVEIEERDHREVTHMGGKSVAARGVRVFNPAFDITPIDLVDGFITEKGVITTEMVGAGRLEP
jgi:methylthioribose-1-phosphate isomerase